SSRPEARIPAGPEQAAAEDAGVQSSPGPHDATASTVPEPQPAPVEASRTPPVPKGPPAPPAPATIGPYDVLATIPGGMGIVYKVHDRDLDRIVALKTLPGDGPAPDHVVQRFDREMRITARLKHPNIVPIYEVGTHDGKPYYTMAYVGGGSLAKHLK